MRHVSRLVPFALLCVPCAALAASHPAAGSHAHHSALAATSSEQEDQVVTNDLNTFRRAHERDMPGEVTPEGSSLVLFAAGLGPAALIAARCRRRR